jgi:hypothetical protein
MAILRLLASLQITCGCGETQKTTAKEKAKPRPRLPKSLPQRKRSLESNPRIRIISRDPGLYFQPVNHLMGDISHMASGGI